MLNITDCFDVMQNVLNQYCKIENNLSTLNSLLSVMNQ